MNTPNKKTRQEKKKLRQAEDIKHPVLRHTVRIETYKEPYWRYGSASNTSPQGL